MLLNHKLELVYLMNHLKVLHNLIINKFMRSQKFNNFQKMKMIFKKIKIIEIKFSHQILLWLQFNKKLWKKKLRSCKNLQVKKNNKQQLLWTLLKLEEVNLKLFKQKMDFLQAKVKVLNKMFWNHLVRFLHFLI